jgi:hypothetical protein
LYYKEQKRNRLEFLNAIDGGVFSPMKKFEVENS